MESHNSSCCSWLPDANICYCPCSAQYANPALPSTRVVSHALEYIAPISYFKNVSTQCVGTLASNDNGRFRFVFGTRWTASRPAAN
ncbi:hypothetical protein OIU77_023354 [Salix suchowensis]|uniref:Uncharacterized protein n=1 Tax=Salix suchowensis TaxID=1278906 RepID=A0ABQ9C6U6_9ROSI|nr:hypothetical protein OIU77_023354 [Salix suchowensis]